MITIYGNDGTKKTQVSCDDNSTQAKELQGDNVLTLSFTLYEHIALEVNDYADFQGERYWLMEQYKPEQVSEQEWKYDVKLYGVESLLKRFLVLNDMDGADEPVFTLTAPPREHVALIVKSINNGMDNTSDWKIGTVEGTDNIVIDYEGKYCDEALKEVAEKAGNRAEWWCEGQTVNVCRCEQGEEVTLSYGKGLTGLECDMADNAKFYTRLYPVGSSKNIDPEKYGHSRLQLPGGVKHVDVNVEKYGVWHHYEAAAFSDIYPKRIGTVSSVRSEVVKDEDGNPFTIFYFKDNSLEFDPNSYEIGGKVKRISFQEGSELAGLGDEEDGTYYFEANYNSDTHEFELITIWPYDDDTQLPNDTLAPKAGDKYILWNIRMPDEYYPLAEQEFKEAVDQYNEEHAIDVSRYKAPTDHVYIEEHTIDLYVGRRVRLESDKYFPETGFRSSRITKVTRKVNLPSQMDLEISDATSTGAMETINDSISDTRNYVKTATSGSFPEVIRSWEQTYPTDNNVFSARRTLKEALSRQRPDRAKGHITLGDGFTSEKDGNIKGNLDVSGTIQSGSNLNVGGNLSVSGTSDLQGKATARGGVQYGASFVPGLTGKGGLIDGEGRGEMRSLRLWEFLEVPELRYNRVNVYTGIRWDTFGAGLVERVDTATGGLWLHLEEGEIGLIEPYDLCMGIWHDYGGGNATATSDDRRGNFSFAGFKTSYFMVTSVPDTDPDGAANTDKHYFTYELREGYAVHPASQMNFACRGNRVHTARQSFTYTTTEYSLLLAGVNDWEFTDSMYKGITGRLDGFSLGGKSFNGYGTVLGNAYIFGQIDQFEKAGRTLGIRDTLGGLMAEGETDTLELRVIDGYGRNVTAEYATWSVSRDTGDATADAAWAVTAPVPELADTEDGKAARLSLGYDDLGSGQQALFTFRATDAGGQTLTQSLTIA